METEETHNDYNQQPASQLKNQNQTTNEYQDSIE